MKRYEYSFRTHISFEDPISNHYYSLKCLPSNYNFQKNYDQEFTLLPSNKYSYSQDSFGNIIVYGTINKEHDFFEYDVKGKVMLTAYKSPELLDWIFFYQTPMTQLNDDMKAFADALDLPEKTSEKVAIVSRAVYQKMNYIPESTSIITSAVEAFSQGKGVCQDYASITIGLLRYLKIPARYCAGLVPGDGQTHGWIEYYDDGLWYGNDPTNDQFVEDRYIKISHGRDAKDCQVDRGSFNSDNSKVKQTIDISISVGEL